MADPKTLARELRRIATGTVEWRVQHPVDKCYCISFDRGDTIDPERAAREWLADHQRRFPHHEHAKYEVAEVRRFSELERVALEAADVLDPSGVGPSATTEPQAPAGMEPNYCNAEQCTCRMGFGYVACDQQPKWKPARGVQGDAS